MFAFVIQLLIFLSTQYFEFSVGQGIIIINCIHFFIKKLFNKILISKISDSKFTKKSFLFLFYISKELFIWDKLYYRRRSFTF